IFTSEDTKYFFKLQRVPTPPPESTEPAVYLQRSSADKQELYLASLDNAINWQYAVDTSLETGETQTFVLSGPWTAEANSSYTTAFGTTSAFVNGALYVPNGAKIVLDLSGNQLNRNLATERAGGYVIYVEGELTITDSSGNHAGLITGGNNSSSSSAGGIHVYKSGKLSLVGVTITGNTGKANTATAGAIYVGGTLEFDNSTVTGNTGTSTGGIYIASSGTFNLNSGAVDQNTATGSSGGGVYTAGAFNMKGGSVNKNYGTAGGVYVANGGTFTLENGTVNENTGNSAGGVFVYSSASASFIMQGGSVSNNRATSAGGAYIAGNAEITGGEIKGNTAEGAVDVDSGGSGLYIAGSGLGTVTGSVITEHGGVNGVRVYSSG
ncbi:MAG: hypothetical protein K2N74_05375, partial [Clostridiales bacterium]|nr:hypothetical protein [Clostridiales bacterium]